MNILVTGGAGYIGSHTIVELLNEDHNIIVIDNLSNSSEESLRRVKKITGKDLKFFKADVRDKETLESIFEKHDINAVVHFAGLKAVGESIAMPSEYYDNNLNSTLVLLKTMQKFGVKTLVFSSSATVYGTPSELPLTENSRVGVGITNPYGQTKFMIEQILKDLTASDKSFNITSLRYFNPIGAHDSGLIGEDPNGIPNNLLPYIAQVAVGKLEKLTVHGNDYDTSDGTGVRDYIHVVDLARAHVAALKQPAHSGEYKAYNIGTGVGVSVLEMIETYKKSSGSNIPYVISERRSGDIATCYADPTLAHKDLGWKAGLTLQDACNSSWKWQSKNPNGFKTT